MPTNKGPNICQPIRDLVNKLIKDSITNQWMTCICYPIRDVREYANQ